MRRFQQRERLREKTLQQGCNSGNAGYERANAELRSGIGQKEKP